MRECLDVGVRFKGRAVPPHAHEVLVLFGEQGHGADPAIALNDNATAWRRVQRLVVVIGRVKRVATFLKPVRVIRNHSHEELVVSRVRAAVHPAQINSVIDACPEVGPLVRVLKIGEVSTAVRVRERDWYAFGVYDEYHVWRR